MSLDERKRSFELAVEATGDHAQTIMSCSDQNMDVAIELARHAEDCGADYIVVHAPLLHFTKAQDETLLRYYQTIADSVINRHRAVEPPRQRLPDVTRAV